MGLRNPDGSPLSDYSDKCDACFGESLSLGIKISNSDNVGSVPLPAGKDLNFLSSHQLIEYLLPLREDYGRTFSYIFEVEFW